MSLVVLSRADLRFRVVVAALQLHPVGLCVLAVLTHGQGTARTKVQWGWIVFSLVLATAMLFAFGDAVVDGLAVRGIYDSDRVSVYLLTLHFGWVPKTYPADEGWFFNPFAWQFLFIVGATAGTAQSAAQPPLPHWPWIPRAAIAVAVAVVVIKLSWLAHDLWDGIPALFHDQLEEAAGDKSNLSPVRLISFFALALTIVHFMPRDSAILRHPLSRLVIVCGQHSLHVFCLGILLSVLGRFIVNSVYSGVLMQVAVNIAGVALMIALAQLMSWYKKKSRPPAPAPVAQASLAR